MYCIYQLYKIRWLLLKITIIIFKRKFQYALLSPQCMTADGTRRNETFWQTSWLIEVSLCFKNLFSQVLNVCQSSFVDSLLRHPSRRNWVHHGLRSANQASTRSSRLSKPWQSSWEWNFIFCISSRFISNDLLEWSFESKIFLRISSLSNKLQRTQEPARVISKIFLKKNWNC